MRDLALGVHNDNNNFIVSEDRTRVLWRSVDAVCFDVDSTVCQDEAIDEIADFCGVGTEVAQMTMKAMNGGLSFREALRARLNIIRPSVFQIEDYLKKNPPRLTPGIRELVNELHRRGVKVFLVSGGFARIIFPVARVLGIPDDHVFANVLHFDELGNYTGFDESQPTSDSGGKAMICGLLKRKHGFKRLVMVGDGATDMEAAPPADGFIGFGGNQVREKVRKEAPWFVMSFTELLSELTASKANLSDVSSNTRS